MSLFARRKAISNKQGRIRYEGNTQMKINRRFTKSSQDVFSTVQYEKRTSRITNPDGSVVFQMNDAEIPAGWSQLATDIMVSKYFRKAGVPQMDAATGKPLSDENGNIAHRPGKIRQAGHSSPRWLLALLGREARLLRQLRRRSGVL